MSCPSCKQEITETHCNDINEELNKLRKLRSEIEKLALHVALDQGLDSEGNMQRRELVRTAMKTYTFYECFDC